MEAKYAFTHEELNRIKHICKLSEKHHLGWAHAVSIFPAETEKEKIWKERMLAGIWLIDSEGFQSRTNHLQ